MRQIMLGIECCWSSIVLNVPQLTAFKMQALLEHHLINYMKEVLYEYNHLMNFSVNVMTDWRIVKSGIEYSDGRQKIIVGHQHTTLLPSVARHTMREGLALVRVASKSGSISSYLLINGECKPF